MRKHSVFKLFIIAGLAWLVMTSNASAFMLPPGPISPTLDIVGDAAQGTKGVGDAVVSPLANKLKSFNENVVSKIKRLETSVTEKINNAKEKVSGAFNQARDAVNNFGQKIKQGFQNVLSKFKGLLHKKEKGQSAVASARKIEEPKLVDVSSEEAIVASFETLFGKYPQDVLKKFPNDQEGVKKKYKDKAVEFSNDAMIELYIAVRDIEDRMDAIGEDIKGMSEKYVLGEVSSASLDNDVSGEAEEANDELGSWVNYYLVSSTYDSILRMTEELIALEAQYESAQSMRGGVDPEDEEEAEETEENKTSSNSYFEMTSSYAQEGSLIQRIKERVKNPKGKLIATQPRVAKSPFDGAAEQFNSLTEVKDLTMVLNQALDAHNLKQQLDTFKGTFVEYNRMRSLHAKAIQQLYQSEKCVMGYLGRYYKDPVETWIGAGCDYVIDEQNGYSIYCNTNMDANSKNLTHIETGYMLCKDNKRKICINSGINSYENRKGLSGFTTSAYKEAKALLALDVVTDEEGEQEGTGRSFSQEDFVVQLNTSVDVKNPDNLNDDVEADTSQKDMKEMERKESEKVTESEAGLDDRSMVKPSKELEFEQLDREREVLGWQIGSAVAKKIGEGMSLGDADEYGRFIYKYDLWEDEKYFYDQYLDLKYKNMEVFVNNLDLRDISIAIAEQINSQIFGIQPEPAPCEEEDKKKCPEPDTNKYVQGVEVGELKNYISSGIANLRKKIIKSDELDPIYALQASIESEIEAQRASFMMAEQAAQSRIKTAYEKLDEINVKLNNAKVAYNDKVNEYVELKGAIKAEDKMIEVSQERKKRSKDVADGYENSSKASKKEAEKSAKAAARELKNIKEEIESARNGIDRWETELANAKENLANIRSSHALLMANLQQKKEKELSNRFDLIRKRVPATLSDELSSSVTMKGRIFSEVIAISDSMAYQAKQSAVQKIKDGYLKIISIGSGKFEPDNYDRLLKIHENILDGIKNPTINVSVSLLKGYMSVANIRSAAQTAMSKALFERICPESKCYKPDAEYFVGLAPQERDFVAPNKISKSYTPPLREIVHFDGVDYDSLLINTKSKGKNTKYLAYESILDYGYEMPAIWHTILGDRGFVDRHVSVGTLLADKEGYPPINDYRARGGLYPCVFTYTVDTVGGISLTPKTSAPGCSHIEKIDVNSVLGRYKVKIKFKDSDKEEVVWTNNVGSGSVAGKVSELRMFTKMSSSGLVFDDSFAEILKYLDELEDKYDVYEKHRADNTIFTQNQIGDFLGYVELEMEYQKTMNELKVKVEEARETLKTEFAKFNYVPKEDFDLSDEKTYKEILDAIDNGKNDFVKEACPRVRAVNTKNIDVLVEKVERLNNVCEILKQDSDELVKLTDNMVPGAELSQNIKTEKADRAAQKEYDKEAEEAHRKNLSEFKTPYCAVY